MGVPLSKVERGWFFVARVSAFSAGFLLAAVFPTKLHLFNESQREYFIGISMALIVIWAASNVRLAMIPENRIPHMFFTGFLLFVGLFVGLLAIR